jgi:hypothetical protein
VQYVVGTTLCVVGYRITDKPAPLEDSSQQQCVGCCEIVWVPKTSPAEPPKICIQCVQEDRPLFSSTKRIVSQSALRPFGRKK